MAAEVENQSGSDSEPEEAPAAKRPRRMILDDDEAEMASTLTSLPSLPQINSLQDEEIYISEGEEEGNGNSRSGDEEEEMEQEMEQYDASQDVSNVDDSPDNGGSLMDNGVCFKLLLLVFF